VKRNKQVKLIVSLLLSITLILGNFTMIFANELPKWIDAATGKEYYASDLKELINDIRQAEDKSTFYELTDDGYINLQEKVLAEDEAIINALVEAEVDLDDEDAILEFVVENIEEINKAINEAVENLDKKSYEDLIEELKVVSVSAIDNTTVQVVIEPLEEDLLGATIDVFDSNGNKVAVKPVDIIAGDDVVFFEFETPVSKADLKGVWTVGGVKYDFDLIAKLEAFVAADNQVKLDKALKDLGIKNVKVENMPAYFDAKGDFLAELEGELPTVEAIQAWIDEINTEQLTEAEKAKAVKAVKDAGENEVLLLQALQEYFVRVNPDWISDYRVKLFGETEPVITKDVTYDAIQGAINNVNDAKISKLTIKENVNKAELLEAKALIEAYATPDDKGEQTKDTKEALKAIDIQLAVADVLEATTPTTLKAKLTALDNLLDKADKFMEDEYVEDNAKLYINGIKDEEGNVTIEGLKGNEKVTSATGDTNSVESVIKAINKAVENAQDKINDRITTVTVGVVNREHDGKTSGKTWLLGYSVGINLANEQEFKNAESVVAELYKGKELLGKMELRDPKNHKGNVISGTIDVYGDYVSTSWKHEWYGELTDRPDKVKVTVKFSDGVAINEKTIDIANESMQPFYVELVNRAETAEEMDAALLKLAEIGNNDYLNVPKADRLYVAEQVLEARNAVKDTKKFADYDALAGDNGALKIAIGARTKALDKVNDLTAEAKIADVIAALELVDPEGFAKMSVADKAEIAEAFFLGLEFDEDGALETTFRTLAEIKAAAGL